MAGKISKKKERAILAEGIKALATGAKVLAGLLLIAAAAAFMVSGVVGGPPVLFAAGIGLGIAAGFVYAVGRALNVMHGAMTSKPSNTGRLSVDTDQNRRPSTTLKAANLQQGQATTNSKGGGNRATFTSDGTEEVRKNSTRANTKSCKNS